MAKTMTVRREATGQVERLSRDGVADVYLWKGEPHAGFRGAPLEIWDQQHAKIHDVPRELLGARVRVEVVVTLEAPDDGT